MWRTLSLLPARGNPPFHPGVDTREEAPGLARRDALVGLLDDTSPVVRQALLSHFAGLGTDAATLLREVERGPNRVLAGHAAWYLRELRFADPVAEFRGYIRAMSYDLETGPLLLARAVSPALDLGRCAAEIDAIAARCREISVEPSGARERCRIINRVLFHEWGFRGNVEHYIDPLNSLLDQVIERRKGNPVSLCIVYLLVAARLEFPLEPIGLPGHFMVGCPGDEMPFFIDPFEQGAIRERDEMLALLADRRTGFRESDLSPVPVREVLCRICRNLVNSYTAAGEPDKVRLFTGFLDEFDAALTRDVR
jgi:regulator of sirC expression with transglutaminase-like and TPR domain